MWDVDNTLGWKLCTNKSFMHHSTYFDVRYTMNSLGFRDKQRGILKEPDTYRILLYGDSQIFGWGVPENKRFSNVVERSQPNLEIWNMAIPGYGLDQQILLYKEIESTLQADHVVFFVSKATLSRIHTNYLYKKYKPMFKLDSSKQLKLVPISQEDNAIIRLGYKILSPLYLPYFLERRLAIVKNSLKKSKIFPGKVQAKDAKTDFSQNALSELVPKMLLMAKTIADGRNHEMSVMTNLSPPILEDLQRVLAQNGISCIKISLKDTTENLILGENDHHWNQLAHSLVAKQFISQLKIPKL
jgi:hypothetical protein